MIRSIWLFFFLLSSVLQLFSQAKETPLINFKQKFLQRKHEDGIEKVDSFSTLNLMIAGNIYQTERHAAYAYDLATGKYNYQNEFKYVQPLLNLGDVTIANLKTSFSNDVNNMFSSPDEFGLALKYAGINVALHANVHTANISKEMLIRTDEVLDGYDVYHTGAFKDINQRKGNYPLIVNKKGFKIAVLNYTTLNTRPTISRDFIINEADRQSIESDMRMARAYKPDFIIAYFDWGANGQDFPSYAQQELAQFVFQAGANLVVGTHPNIPMRIDQMNYSYNTEPREGIIAYSLGNLISSNEQPRNRNGFIIDMEIKKNNFTSKTIISDWGVIPVNTYYDTTSTLGKTKVFTVPCANVESGDILPNLSYIEKRRVVNSAYEVRKLLGNTADEIQYNLNELVVNNVMESIDITNAPLNNKYNPKREEEIIPSAAPVLPVAINGSANPPSLTLLYGAAADTPSEKASAHAEKSDKKKTQEPVSAIVARREEEKKKIEEKLQQQEVKVTTLNPGQLTATTPPSSETIQIAKDTEWERDTFYRIQFYALKTFIPLDTNYYTHLKGYEVRMEHGLYKYMLGKYRNYQECEQYWKSQIQPRYKQSFIVTFVNGKRIAK